MFDLQPTLHNDLVKIVPLKENDFDVLYEVASDPLIWEQHPNKNRYQKEVFQNFFKGAVESKGAFLVYDAKTNAVIGSSRFYEYDEIKSEISIGYTFVSRNCWGKGHNPALKQLMMQHAFQFVNNIIFHIGSQNIRSQKAIQKLGAVKIDELDMKYYGEQNTLNFIYRIVKNA